MSEKNKAELILAVDTTGKNSNVTIAKGKEICVTLSDNDDSRSSELLGLINRALKSRNLQVKDINLFAHASGPGSFTGIRVGISTLRALSFAVEKPCVGVPTLKAIAHLANSSSDTFTLMPSRKGDVFVQTFRKYGHTIQSLSEVSSVNIDVLLEDLKSRDCISLAGYGAIQYKDEIKKFTESKGIDFFEVEAEDFALKEHRGWYLITNTSLSESVAALALQSDSSENFKISSTNHVIYTT